MIMPMLPLHMGDSDSLQFVASSRSVDPDSDPCWSTLDDGYWDPAAFAAEIARMHKFGASTAAIEDGTVASSDTESETSNFLPQQPNKIKSKNSCKKTSDGKHVPRKSWSREEEKLFQRALHVFGQPDVETDPASGRVSVRLGPV